MEAAALTLSGENAERFAERFVGSKANESRTSLNQRGVRNIHRYEGEGFTHVSYERAAAHEDSWLVISVLAERVDDRTTTVVVKVGGGGEGPFKLEELTTRRFLRDEEEFGESGRFVDVLEEITDVCASLDLDVEVTWDSSLESSTLRALEEKILHA